MRFVSKPTSPSRSVLSKILIIRLALNSVINVGTVFFSILFINSTFFYYSLHHVFDYMAQKNIGKINCIRSNRKKYEYWLVDVDVALLQFVFILIRFHVGLDQSCGSNDPLEINRLTEKAYHLIHFGGEPGR